MCRYIQCVLFNFNTTCTMANNWIVWCIVTLLTQNEMLRSANVGIFTVTITNHWFRRWYVVEKSHEQISIWHGHYNVVLLGNLQYCWRSRYYTSRDPQTVWLVITWTYCNTTYNLLHIRRFYGVGGPTCPLDSSVVLFRSPMGTR